MELKHDPAARRFSLPLEPSGAAILTYEERAPGTLDLLHTLVPSAERGKGIGSELVRQVLGHAQEQGLRVIPTCPFVAAYMQRHPEFAGLRA